MLCAGKSYHMAQITNYDVIKASKYDNGFIEFVKS